MSRDENRREAAAGRRRFCQAAGFSACALATGGAGMLSVDFLRPRVLFEPPTRVKLGPVDSVGVGAVIADEVHRLFVIRKQDGFRALSSICSHLGCITRYRPDDRIIACPCHGSRFNLDGEVLAGPAPRPLQQFEMALSDEGEIIVETALEVPPGTVFKL